MYNIGKERLEQFFHTSEKKNFSMILVERRGIPGDMSRQDVSIPDVSEHSAPRQNISEKNAFVQNIPGQAVPGHVLGQDHYLQDDILEQCRSACENLLQASYVTHDTELIFHRIVCFLNYDRNYFSVRSFADSLRHVLFTIGMASHTYVFYSEAFSSAEELVAELQFLFENTKYGLLLGNHQPIPSRFLHGCQSSTHTLNHVEFPAPYAEFGQHGAGFVAKQLLSASEYFQNMINRHLPYSFSELLDYISEVYFGVRQFFAEKQYPCPPLDTPLYDAFILHNGISGILHLLSGCVSKYSNLFPDAAAPDVPAVPAISISDRGREHVREILEYTDQNISTVSLSGLASHFDLTSSYICRLMKKEKNIKFTEYVKKRRLELAAQTLQSNMKITISDLSEQLGYKSQSYFQNSFKEEFGISPDAYRKEYHKKNS